MTIPFLKQQGWTEWETGGGCRALAKETAHGHLLLITDEDGTGLPVEGEPMLAGVLTSEGCDAAEILGISCPVFDNQLEAAACCWNLHTRLTENRIAS